MAQSGQEFATKADIQGMLQAFREELRATKDDLRSEISRCASRENLEKVMHQVADLTGQVAEIRHFLKTEVVTKDYLGKMTSFVQGCVEKIEVYKEDHTARGQLLTDCLDVVQLHEKRIGALEAKKD